MKPAPLKLLTIPPADPKLRSIIHRMDAGTVMFTGQDLDAPDLLCGRCAAVLVVGVKRAAINNIVLICSGCGAYNDTAFTN